MQAGKVSMFLLAAALCASTSQIPTLAKETVTPGRVTPPTATSAPLTVRKAPFTVTVDDAGTSKTLKQGETATIAVKTAPGAQGTITVKLKSGASRNAALVPQKASADGVIKWSWTVAKNTAPGPIAWTVAVNDKNRTAQTTGTIVVQEAQAAKDTGKSKTAGLSKKGKTGK